MAEVTKPAASKQTWKEMLEHAIAFKSEGNQLFKDKEYKKAAGKYHRGLLYLKGIDNQQHQLPFPIPSERPAKLTDEEMKSVSAVRIDIYNNLSACLLHMDPPKYDKVCQYCEHVLEEKPGNTKAMYRCAVAQYHLKNVDPALIAFRKLISANPNDSNVKKYLELCEKECARQDESLKKTYKGMFDKLQKTQE